VAALVAGAWVTPAQAVTYAYTESSAMISIGGEIQNHLIPGPGGSPSEPHSYATANSLGNVVPNTDQPGSGLDADALAATFGTGSYAENTFVPTGGAGDYAIGDSRIDGSNSAAGPRFFLDTFAEASQSGLGNSSGDGQSGISIYFEVLVGSSFTLDISGEWSGSDAATATGANESAYGGNDLGINVYAYDPLDPTVFTHVWGGTAFSTNFAEGLPGAPGSSSNTYGPSPINMSNTFFGGHYMLDIVMHSQLYLTSKDVGDPDPVPVPEPATLALLGAGAATALTRARRATS
jgi:hypothetical protein